MSKKNRMKKFKINELSAVDKPAQVGAQSVLMKRDSSQDDKAFAKGGVLLSESNGHTHLLVTDRGEGEMQSGSTRWAKAPGDEHDHDHAWVRNPDGSITIGASNGHTHEVNVNKSDQGAVTMFKTKKDLVAAIVKYLAGDTSQADEIKKAAGTLGHVDLLPGALNPPADNTAAIAKAESLALMTDAQKTYYKSQDADGQAQFLKMDEATRDAEVEKANAPEDKDTIVYKSADGTVFTKADDPRFVKMAKDNDALAKTNKALTDAAGDADIAKRAQAAIPNLGGDTDTRTAMFKAVDGIEDEDVRKAALESLTTANTNAGSAFVRKGTSDPGISGEAGDANDQLDALAKKRSEAEGIDIAKAYTDVLATDEGRTLYEQTLTH